MQESGWPCQESFRASSPKRSQRMMAILARLSSDTSTSPAALAEELHVSAATIRRDLAILEKQQLLARTHGGVRRLGTETELPVSLKRARYYTAKSDIAREAVRLIPPGRHIVALNGGSTVIAVGRALARRHDLTVVTNSLTTASQISSDSAAEVIMTGGVIRRHSLELVGTLAESAFSALNIGTAVLGVDGINASAGATTYNRTEARANGAMIRRARQVIVVADSSKVGRTTGAAIASAVHVNVLVTDAAADPAELDRLRNCGMRVHVVGRLSPSR